MKCSSFFGSKVRRCAEKKIFQELCTDSCSFSKKCYFSIFFFILDLLMLGSQIFSPNVPFCHSLSQSNKRITIIDSAAHKQPNQTQCVFLHPSTLSICSLIFNMSCPFLASIISVFLSHVISSTKIVSLLLTVASTKYQISNSYFLSSSNRDVVLRHCYDATHINSQKFSFLSNLIYHSLTKHTP